MNNIRNLTSVIEKDAAEYREKTIAEAAKEVEAIRARYNAEADELRGRYKEKAQAAFEQSVTGTKAAVAMQSRNMMLETKNELVAEVLSRAERAIASRKGADRARIYARFASGALQPKEGGLLILCEADAGDRASLFAAVNAAAREKGVPEVALSERTVPGACGFIIAYGELEYNCLLSEMMAEMNAELFAAAVRGLFS